MAKKIAINGFGRIGRLTLRNLLKNKDIEVVAINDLTDNATVAHLFKYHSAQGTCPGKVSASANHIEIGNKKTFGKAGACWLRRTKSTQLYYLPEMNLWMTSIWASACIPACSRQTSP